MWRSMLIQYLLFFQLHLVDGSESHLQFLFSSFCFFFFFFFGNSSPQRHSEWWSERFLSIPPPPPRKPNRTPLRNFLSFQSNRPSNNADFPPTLESLIITSPRPLISPRSLLSNRSLCWRTITTTIFRSTLIFCNNSLLQQRRLPLLIFEQRLIHLALSRCPLISIGVHKLNGTNKNY